MGQLEDMLLGVNNTMRHTNILLAHLYKVQQQREADKTPHDLRVYTVNVVCPSGPNPQAMQVLPRNGTRKQVTIFNSSAAASSSDVLISAKQFDPQSILQLISDPGNPDTVLPAPMQVVEIAILAAGAAPVTLITTAPIWVYNTKVTTNLGALLTMYEQNYVVPNRQPTEAGSDGRIFQGYAPIPGADASDGVQEAKALR